ncbi:MAG: hypothetical protein R2762_10750 [Bryobacteraceae bacterium]
MGQFDETGKKPGVAKRCVAESGAEQLGDAEKLGQKTLGALRGIVSHQPSSETAGRIAIWLWVEDPEFAKRAVCCTAPFAADIHAMPAHRRRQWRGLLLQADISGRDRPCPEWLEQSRRRIAALGRAEFQFHVAHWLNSIPATGRADQQPTPVTRLGSHLLKSLVWWSTLCREGHLDDAVVRLAGVRWSRKVRQRRVAGAVAFAVAGMHEATQIPDLAISPPVDSFAIDYLSPIV